LKEEGSEIKLAKVDATIEKELGDKAGVRGFPTMKFYKNGNAMDYGGGRDTDKIIAWLKKKTGPAAKVLSTSDEVTAFSESADITVVGYFNNADSAEAKEFIATADRNEDAVYGVSYDEAVVSSAGGQSIALYTKDEGKFNMEKEATTLTAKKLRNSSRLTPSLSAPSLEREHTRKILLAASIIICCCSSLPKPKITKKQPRRLRT